MPGNASKFGGLDSVPHTAASTSRTGEQCLYIQVLFACLIYPATLVKGVVVLFYSSSLIDPFANHDMQNHALHINVRHHNSCRTWLSAAVVVERFYSGRLLV